jgi:nitrogen fixation/metabolism regulation signal transduction histidine kinase
MHRIIEFMASALAAVMGRKLGRPTRALPEPAIDVASENVTAAVTERERQEELKMRRRLHCAKGSRWFRRLHGYYGR